MGASRAGHVSDSSETCEEGHRAFNSEVLDSSSTAQLAMSTSDDVSTPPIGNAFNSTNFQAVQCWVLSTLSGGKKGRVPYSEATPPSTG